MCRVCVLCAWVCVPVGGCGCVCWASGTNANDGLIPLAVSTIVLNGNTLIWLVMLSYLWFGRWYQ